MRKFVSNLSFCLPLHFGVLPLQKPCSEQILVALPPINLKKE